MATSTPTTASTMMATVDAGTSSEPASPTLFDATVGSAVVGADVIGADVGSEAVGTVVGADVVGATKGVAVPHFALQSGRLEGVLSSPPRLRQLVQLLHRRDPLQNSPSSHCSCEWQPV